MAAQDEMQTLRQGIAKDLEDIKRFRRSSAEMDASTSASVERIAHTRELLSGLPQKADGESLSG